MLQNGSILPSMDAEGFAFFRNSIKKSKCYLEYGSGGSTIYAANTANVESIISIESDKKWVGIVQQSLASIRKNIHLEHCDIGEVANWGAPKNTNKINCFWEYSTKPWALAAKNNLHPDLVLIDGRFRVASFLYSVMCSDAGTIVLFDDYTDRPQYAVVEDFCSLKSSHGRMGVFVVDKKYSAPDIAAKFAKYSIKWG